jgi:hypothetical protein
MFDGYRVRQVDHPSPDGIPASQVIQDMVPASDVANTEQLVAAVTEAAIVMLLPLLPTLISMCLTSARSLFLRSRFRRWFR